MVDRGAEAGWEAFAEQYMRTRSRSIGAATVGAWAAQLPVGGAVLDLGCGFGEPNARALVEAGFEVFGVEASPTLAAACRTNVPGMTVACERVEDSAFFGRSFDGIVAIGLVFLLEPSTQRAVLGKAAAALREGGRLLFSAPWQVCSWETVPTGQVSRSLGREAYAELLGACGLVRVEECVDEGENHHFHFVRSPSR